jgi:hypothetical protein
MENHWRFSQLPDIVEPETEHNLMCTGVVLVEVGICTIPLLHKSLLNRPLIPEIGCRLGDKSADIWSEMLISVD